MSAESLKGRTALVTGGLGFIGSALARELLDRGARVRILDSLLPQSGGSPLNVAAFAQQLEIVIEDTRSRDVVDRVVEGCDLVFHLAGQSGPKAFGADVYSDVDIACLGTLNVLEATRVRARGARLVFASSFHVYGNPHTLPVREGAATEPATIFGVHKLAGEKYCGVYSGDIDVVCARLGTIVGPRLRLQGAMSGSVAHTLDAALHGEEIHLRGRGGEVHDLLHVGDAVVALVALGLVPEVPGRVVNVASGEGMTTQAIARIATSACGRGRIVEGDPDGMRSSHFVADVSRLRALGVAAPLFAAEAALRDTIGWLRGEGSLDAS